MKGVNVLSTELNQYILKEWELRFSVLLSLLIQIFLIVTGTLRRSSQRWIDILLWLAYLLADIVAVFGLGLIVSKQSLYAIYCIEGQHYAQQRSACYQDCVHVYWAPFLLVHLGGPDFITSFSPEDNALWRRHLFYLASQCITVAYCFYQSHQFSQQLRIPAMLMFLCGLIKCSERICALYYASANSFRRSLLSLPDLDAYDLLKKDITARPRLQHLENMNSSLSHLEVLQYAFVYFNTFKRLVADLILGIHDRNLSRGFFLVTSYKDAFRIVEVELNYIYDVLFTKLPVLHHKFGYCSRTLSFVAVVASFALFHFVVKKEKIFGLDQVITYVLLIGAIALDVIQFFMLLTCNCTVVKILPLSNANANSKPWKLMFGEWILFVNRTRNTFLDWLLGIFRRRECDTFTNSRCAESLSTINLISFCLNRGSKGRRQFHNYFGLANFLNGIWHVKPRLLTHDMTSFIFDELKVKSMVANSLETAERICSSKGEWVLQEIEGHDAFLPFVSNYNYAETVLLWHISTELCCNGSQDQVTYYAQRDIAKNLSDYMLYLLVMKPDMVSSVSSAGNKMFLDTCIEVGKLFDIKLPELKKRMSGFFGRESKKEKEALHIKACETIFCINRDVKPVLLQKEDRYKLLLFDASVLAKELKLLPLEQKWLTISKLWVELLSYAATHIRSSAHVQNLSKGGELITVVWLLMAHFGLGDQFEISCVDI
ncbi:hypothetical protein DCAR_0207359 [Daucus carota subsp. sativus]|uniref:DUF4220 domain-containing protein n=1 Tax=Daucus carota subsp. sativus TaxID=79200 RepID=A0A166DUE8_DAUCS|nr:PREDICTED: uncharacterized protein LOC108207593 [Daucus carota subsp. sativus]WOG88125.1 hypothetical protein DCAR_0207359 [Daucus carota subsp. sativus]